MINLVDQSITEIMAQITAEIDREVLLETLTEAHAAFKQQVDDAREKIIQKLMEKRVRVSLFTTRTRTRDEAEAYWTTTDRMYVPGYWELYHARQRLERVKEMTEAVKSDKLSSIRLPEDDLRLLQNFM